MTSTLAHLPLITVGTCNKRGQHTYDYGYSISFSFLFFCFCLFCFFGTIYFITDDLKKLFEEGILLVVYISIQNLSVGNIICKHVVLTHIAYARYELDISTTV